MDQLSVYLLVEVVKLLPASDILALRTVSKQTCAKLIKCFPIYLHAYEELTNKIFLSDEFPSALKLHEEVESIFTSVKLNLSKLTLSARATLLARKKQYSAIVLVTSLADRSPQLKTWPEAKATFIQESFTSNLATVDLPFLLTCPYRGAIDAEVISIARPKKEMTPRALMEINWIVQAYHQTLKQVDKLCPGSLQQFMQQRCSYKHMSTISKLASRL
jgi:hypothetical protein